MKNLKIQLLIDNPDSWMWDYVNLIQNEIFKVNKYCKVIKRASQVSEGDVLILLSCNRVFKNLDLNKYNIVIHESDLPKGKGFSPLTWQILEGKNIIPICMFEANKDIDAGEIYFKDEIFLKGHELIDEIREKQAFKTLDLILKFLNSKFYPKKKPQIGEETHYRKRKKNDNKIDINKSIKENFNKLRVIDNIRYPAFFEYMDHEYTIRIEKSKN